MEILDEQAAIWQEIERGESYLVCCMFEEATSIAYSVLRRLLENDSSINKGYEVTEDYESERDNMLESAGMVLVQSMNQSQRKSEILKELKMLFGSVTAIPFELFLTGIDLEEAGRLDLGVCLQVSDSSSSIVEDFLEEFLINCKYVDGQYFLLLNTEDNVADNLESCSMFPIGIDNYLKVVDLYVMNFLVKKDTDVAISWINKTMLPMEKHQELLRQLISINSSVVGRSSQTSTSLQLIDELNAGCLPEKEPRNGHQKNIRSQNLSSGGNTAKEEILRLARQRSPSFWLFPTFNLKVGNIRLVVPSAKILLASLLLLMYYFTRKKQANFRRFLVRKAVSVRRAFLDLCQLAFSYQVNPLAAVQTLPTASAPRGSR